MSARNKPRAKAARRVARATRKGARIEWPEAMADYLAARGIKREWAEGNGLRPLDAGEVKKLLGPKYQALARGRSAIHIPYYDLDGRETGHYALNFAGQPPAPGHEPAEGEKVLKALSKPGEPSMAYVPRLPPPGDNRSNREIANDARVPIVTCEGQIKILCATFLGYRGIGFAGVDNFHPANQKDRPVELLRDFAMRGRSVSLINDSDQETNEQVRRASGEQTLLLKGLGADVCVVHLPALAGRKSTGLDDFLVERGRAGLDKLLAMQPRLPDHLDTGDELIDTEFPPLDFAIPTYLPKREVVEVHGAHGQFKSTIMLYACLAVATGEPWGTCAVEQGSSVFISLEDRASTLQRRLLGWKMDPPKFSNEPRRDRARLDRGIRERFAYLGRERAASLVLTETSYGQTLPRRAAIDRIVTLCAGRDLVVLETAARLHPGGETNEALAVLASVLEEIAERTGACVVLVRHVSKEAARSGITDSYAGRGGGALADAARSVLSVERRGDHPFDPVFLAHTKSTHTGRGPDLAWRPEAIGDLFRLRTATPDDIAKAAECRWFDLVAAAGRDGIRQSDLEKRADSGKGDRRKRVAEFRAAIDELVKQGRIVRRAVGTGHGRKPVVLWAAGLEPKEDDA